MEHQKEKKRKLHPRRKRTQPKPTFSLPLDVTSEILSKLFAKSIARFRCVSKQWSSITKQPYFNKSFQTQSSTRPELLFCLKKGKKMFVFSILQPRNSNESYTCQPFEHYHIKFPEISNFSHTESVHGLICFHQSGNPIVWNPSTRQFLHLGKPRRSWNDPTVLLGYDPIEGKHKVLCLPRYLTCNTYRVLTLGSAKESWRGIKTKIKHRSFFKTYGRRINGVVYYIVALSGWPGLCIMSFDVRSEKINMIQLPSDFIPEMLTTYEEKLACVVLKNDTITLWILKDSEKHEWSSKHFDAPFAHRDGRIDYKLKGITQAGEFVYAPCTFHNPFSIFYFHQEENLFRKIEFNGLTDNECCLTNRLRGGCIYALHTFPNRIESLMALL